MKKHSFFVFLAFSFLVSSNLFTEEPSQLPPPRGYVTDLANLIDHPTEQKIEQLASSINRETTAQIAVLTVKSISPYTVEQFAVEAFEKMGIGHKDKDNGVLLLVANQEKKLRIEVGYGLEGAIPDITAKKIIDNAIVPYFKKDNFNSGILLGVVSLAEKIAAEYNVSLNGIVDMEDLPSRKSQSLEVFSFLIFIFFAIIFPILAMNGNPSRRRFYRNGYWIGGYGAVGGRSRGGFSSGGFSGFGGGFSGGGGASGGW